MVMLLGGCCAHCGYNKNISALTFHHLEYKNIPLSGHNLSSNSDELLLEELKGCALLCANCHRFTHKHKIRLEPFQLPGELGWRHNRMKLKKSETKTATQAILQGKPNGRRDKLTVIRIYEQCGRSAKATCLKLWGSRTPKRLSWIREIIDEENARTTQGTSPEA